MKKSVYTFILLLVILACNYRKPPEIDRYYSVDHWDRKCPRIPLYEPLAVYQDRCFPNKWFLTFQDFLSSKKDKIKYELGATIDSINYIGVDRGVVHGSIDQKYFIMNDPDFGDYAFMDDQGAMYFPKQNRLPSPREVQIELIDTNARKFLIPKRWYVITTQDTSFTFIFKEAEYKRKLEDLKM